MTIQEVAIQYEGRLRDLETGIAQLRFPNALSAVILVTAIGVFLALSLYAIRGQVSLLWPSLPVPVAAASARRLQQHREARSRMWRLRRFYGRAVDRVKGNWAGSGVTGEEFRDPAHVYAKDLQVFGEGSLYELLCIARTSIGQRGLANYLLETQELEETRLRQGAVREMRGRVDLRERIATLGEFEFFESRWGIFEEWLKSPRFSFPRVLPLVFVITSAVLAGLVLAGFTAAVAWTTIAVWIYGLIAFHSWIGVFFRDQVNRTLDHVRPVSVETQVLREGLQLIEREEFGSVKLRQLVERVRKAPACIRKLERLLGALDQRDKEWFYLPSRLLLTGTQTCMAIERWRSEHGESLGIWLQAWGEFEALNALAAYGYENPDNTFPELTGGDACFEARELSHPLLSNTCVANDIELNRRLPFYVISGSNMSGKSTLLRAIGLNAVLAFAGAPVRASVLRVSALSVFASMSMEDSLLKGKSKFLVEVNRLREAIESAEANRPVLFLVDEILSGTNSRDRRIAAEAVIRTLVNRGAIGALSTHDLALTEIASSEGVRGVNVHMGSRDERDPMDFDYLLKPGIATQSNALAIARMAGVPV